MKTINGYTIDSVTAHGYSASEGRVISDDGYAVFNAAGKLVYGPIASEKPCLDWIARTTSDVACRCGARYGDECDERRH